MNGKTIIPLSKKYSIVGYLSPFLYGRYDEASNEAYKDVIYYTKEGKEILLDYSKYDEVYVHTGNGLVWFATKKNGKEGACDTNGNEIVPPIFESCFYSNFDGEFKIKDSTGHYHKWSEYSKNAQNTYSSNNTHSSNSTTDSKSANLKELFDLAYNTPDKEAQTKYNRYMQVIQADPYNSYGYKAVAYNNLGALYESLGDLKNAKKYYKYALQVNPNYDKAKKNLKNVKSQRWDIAMSILGAVTNTLGSIGEYLTNSTYSTNNTYNTYQSAGSHSNSSSSSSSVSSKCKRCQVSGKCSSVDAYTSVKYYCGGSGKCKYCLGSGIVTNLGQTITCTACNGTGKCSSCGGTGK